MLGLIGSWLRRAVDHKEPATVERSWLYFLSLPLVASRVIGSTPVAPIVIFFWVLAPASADGGQRSDHFLFRGVTNFATPYAHASPPHRTHMRPVSRYDRSQIGSPSPAIHVSGSIVSMGILSAIRSRRVALRCSGDKRSGGAFCLYFILARPCCPIPIPAASWISAQALPMPVVSAVVPGKLGSR